MTVRRGGSAHASAPRRRRRAAGRSSRRSLSGRLAGIDLARAVALMGMLVAHLSTTRVFDPVDPGTWSGAVDGRASILFATLAGVSISLISGREVPVGGIERRAVRVRLGVRAIVIWAIGVLLVATGLPVYVVLPAYGLLFALSIPIVGLPARVLLTAAAGLAVTMPFVVAPVLVVTGTPAPQSVPAAMLGWWYPFPVWFVFVVAGMGVGRLPLHRAAVQTRLLGAGVVLAAAGYASAALAGVGEGSALSQDAFTRALAVAPHSGGVFEVVGSGGVAIAVIGLCLLLCRPRVLRALLWPLRAAGSMPLTMYVGQLLGWWLLVVAGLPIGELAALRERHPVPWFVAGSVVFASVWRAVAGSGPLERMLARADTIAAIAVTGQAPPRER